MKNRYFLLLSLLLLLTTCIDPVSVRLNEAATRLVVDGLITTKPGPYTVKLTTTSKYSTGSEGTNLLVTGAKVSIADDAGNREELFESSNGIYTTQAGGIQGQIGRSYTLEIETSEGKQYRSRPEFLQETPGVENVYYEFKEESASGPEGFYVYADTKDPAQTEDFYRWTWTHYERLQYCLIAGTPEVPYPCCTDCWTVTRCNGCVNIASDRLNNGGLISRQLLTVVPYTSTSNYFLYFEQYSLSRDAFKFWNALDDQVNNVGGIFDRPPATIRGNILNIIDPEDIALGYFGTSDVKPGFVVVQRAGIAKNPSGPLPPSFPVMGMPPPCVPCEERSNRTAITPPFWQD